MIGGAMFDDPFAVGAVVTALIALAFFLDRRFRVFSFFGTAWGGHGIPPPGDPWVAGSVPPQVYVTVDMEGFTGVTHPEDVTIKRTPKGGRW